MLSNLQQEVLAVSNESPAISRAVSPTHRSTGTKPSEGPLTFPFKLCSGHTKTSMRELLSPLPAKDDALLLVDSYFRYFAWQYV
jgi:hypothetical protein